MVTPATSALPRPNYGADAYLGVNAKNWAKEARAGTSRKGGPRWWRSCNHGSGVPVSHNTVGEIGLANELKELTMEPIEAMVQPKTARAELAVCARTVLWRTAVAWLR